MVIGFILVVFAVLFIGALASAASRRRNVTLVKPVRGGRSRGHRDSWWAGGAGGAGSS